jgi:hypothetical protein
MQLKCTLAALLFALSARTSGATSIVIVVASDGIVVASDSKQVLGLKSGLAANPESARKVIVLNHRVAVSIVGWASTQVTCGSGVLYRFDTMEMLEGIKSSLPADAPISSIENVIVDKLKIALDRLAPYVANGLINQENSGRGDFIELIVAGYENGVPAVSAIWVEPDWNARKLSSPFVKSRNPSPNRPNNSYMRIYGETQSIVRAGDPRSPEWKAAKERYPGVVQGIDMVRRGLSVNSTDGIRISTDFIRLESEFDSENVGPPINIVVLSNTHEPLISVLPK